MKIVVSVDELASEARMVIDNMIRSNAPVLIGDDPARPRAVLLSVEEYQRLQRQAESADAATRTHSAPAPEVTQPLEPAPSFDTPRPLIPNLSNSRPARQPQPAESNNVAQRAAATVQADRAAVTPSTPTIISQRQSTLQPDPLTMNRPLPKPPRPLGDPKGGVKMPFSVAAVPGGWQTIALVAGVLLLGIVGFVLILNAFG
jgi:PHD/YefM family antitoxin component YafN of YafNO toxin-antitoxin module